MAEAPRTPPGDAPDDRWGDWEAHRQAQAGAWLASTPAQRLAWLEEAIALAARCGALPRAPDVAPRLDPEWRADFEASLRRPLRERLRYAFIHTHKPVLDDAPVRVFDTMSEYRAWCRDALPDWLGYG